MIPIVSVFIVIKVGESFSREERGEIFSDDANIFADGTKVVAEFQFADVVERLRDDFGERSRIFKISIKLELEENL